MKIIAVGRNYVNHAKELNNAVPVDEPVIFMKPETAALKDNYPFYYPEFSTAIHYEVEIVLKISKMGKCIEQRFAHGYIAAIGLGIDFTARDLQESLRKKGLPWELAKAFDSSAPISSFMPISTFKDINNINFRLCKNSNEVQRGNTSQMLFNMEQLICFISKYVTLKKGDLIFTGTPEGVGPIAIGDHLEGWIEEYKALDFYIK